MRSGLSLAVLGLVLASCAAAFAASPAQVVLSQKNVASVQIVLPASATAQEQNAASELKDYLGKITGGTFVVRSEDSAASQSKSIYVGQTLQMAKTFPDIKPSQMGTDGIVVKTSPSGDLYIAGQGKRGTLYAAYTFLEDFCGVRWWTPDTETVPANADLVITAPDVQYTPVLEYRETFSILFTSMEKVYPDNLRTRFSVKMKNNGFINNIPDEWGGNDRCLPGGWPTFSTLIPKAKYFEKHPEWFSLIDGKRVDSQLCLSNLEMRKEMARNLIALIKRTPGVKHITITQNDNGKNDNCQCDDCRRIDKAEKAPSGLLLQCVNEVADEVAKEYPDVYVNTLAYHYNRESPRITRPRGNVSIQVCAPFDRERFENDKEFMSTLKTWGRIAPKTYAWTYFVDFGDVTNPQPNCFNFGPNIRALVANNVTGVFAQGNAFAGIGDLPELQGYVVAKLLWNPNADDKALIHDFVNAYYGKAAPYILEYIKLLDADFMPEVFAPHNAYGKIPVLTPWMSLSAMNQTEKLFRQAKAAVADNPVQQERIAKAKIAIDFQWICGWNMYKGLADSRKVEFLGPADPNLAFNQFMADCKRWNVKRLCEGNGSLNILHKAIFGK